MKLVLAMGIEGQRHVPGPGSEGPGGMKESQHGREPPRMDGKEMEKEEERGSE